MEMLMKNGLGRVGEIKRNFGGGFEVFIGFVDDNSMRGMQVVDRKVYKNHKSAKSFVYKWFDM